MAFSQNRLKIILAKEIYFSFFLMGDEQIFQTEKTCTDEMCYLLSRTIATLCADFYLLKRCH